MNAGELVVSLLLKAGDFKAQVQSAQERLDGVQAAAVDAGRATYDLRPLMMQRKNWAFRWKTRRTKARLALNGSRAWQRRPSPSSAASPS